MHILLDPMLRCLFAANQEVFQNVFPVCGGQGPFADFAMDQPMRWVCLCLDAHNFVVGPAPRADEISKMMHRSHVQPPVPRQPASSLHAENPNSHLRFGIGGSPETPPSRRRPFSRGRSL